MNGGKMASDAVEESVLLYGLDYYAGFPFKEARQGVNKINTLGFSSTAAVLLFTQVFIEHRITAPLC